MISMGVLLTGNAARFVLLSGTRQDHQIIAKRTNKLELPPNPTQDDSTVFIQAFSAICKTNAVDIVAINFRATKGQGAGGPGTFRTEGILLAAAPCPIRFIHSATTRATEKKQSSLKVARPQTSDLAKAYDIAFEALA